MNTFKVETEGYTKWVAVSVVDPDDSECDIEFSLEGIKNSDDYEEAGMHALLSYVEELQSKPMPSEEEIAALVEEFMDDASLANENDFVYFAKEILKKWGNYELSRPEN